MLHVLDQGQRADRLKREREARRGVKRLLAKKQQKLARYLRRYPALPSPLDRVLGGR